MPLPLLPLIGIGAGLLETGINAASTSANNRKQRQWSEQMYARQRADSLADMHFQNEYNSPAAQMARLKAAGLNPNLVYGSGTNQQAAAARSSSVESWNPEAPQVSLGAVRGGIMDMYDIQLKGAQTDNLKAARDVAVQDAALRAAQTANTAASTARTGVQTEQDKLNLSIAKQLETVSLETAKAQLDKLKADTAYTLNSDARAEISNAKSIEEASTRILKMLEENKSIVQGRQLTKEQISKMKVDIENAKKDGTLKDLDINLRRLGINPNDPVWARILGQIVSGDLSLKEINSKLNQHTRDAFKRRYPNARENSQRRDSTNHLFRKFGQ